MGERLPEVVKFLFDISFDEVCGEDGIGAEDKNEELLSTSVTAGGSAGVGV